MKSKRIDYFATRKDLLEAFESIEALRILQYCKTGLFDSSTPEIYPSGKNLPNLGISLDGKQNMLPIYMVLDSNAQVEIRPIPQHRGGVKFAIDGMLNSESVFLQPSGLYEERSLIYGCFGAEGEENDFNRDLFRDFQRLFFKGFIRIQTFHVGPEALVLFEQGIRLTPNDKADRSMDLTR